MEDHSFEGVKENIITQIIACEDSNSCWNVLSADDPHYPNFNYYVPNYKSTLWTLVLVADLDTSYQKKHFLKPLKIITNQFFNKESGIFSIGKSHFPIPCLNGNMIYLHEYFGCGDEGIINKVIAFFDKYQRFDDGDYITPRTYPYFGNRSCYGKHTCYWGIVKLLKGLSFIPKNRRTRVATRLIEKCIDFILLHRVCFSSHRNSDFLSKNIDKITFPNMYKSDFLEILWLLKRENVQSDSMDEAVEMLKNKAQDDGTWVVERAVKDLLVMIKKKHRNAVVTKKAKEVFKNGGADN